MKKRNDSRRTALASAITVALSFGLVACGGGGGGSSTGESPAVEPPYTGLAWFDPKLIAAQNTATTDGAKEEIAKNRAKLLIAAMTESQKLDQLTGAGNAVVPELPSCFGGRHVKDIPELGIRTLRISNGPVGVGQNDCAPIGDPQPLVSAASAQATALPSAIAMAASFDRTTAKQYGDVIATEMNNLGLDVFEAPGVNMARIPTLGRNFEYFGEDPFLTGTMAVEESKAIQAAGLIAMPKHFVANEQETMRQKTYSTVDDQTLREIYLLPFEMAVKDAKVGSIMCAYNYLNGVQACENDKTQNKILRDEWGFTGYVQSDFLATRSLKALSKGMDHEMPAPALWAPDKVKAALADPNSGITWALINQALERRFTQMFKLGILDRPIKQTPINFVAGGGKARDIGNKSSVLLKNRGNLLPLASTLGSSDYVTIIGKSSQPYAQQAVMGGAVVGKVVAAGSSDVIPNYTVTPVAGIANALGVSVGSSKVRLILVDDSNTLASVNGVPMTYADAIANHINQSANKAIIFMVGTIAEEGGDRGTVSYTTSFPSAQESFCGFVLTCAVTNIGWDSDPLYHPKDGMTLDWYSASGPGVMTKKVNARSSGTQAMIDNIMAANASLKDRTVLVLKDNASFSVPDSLIGANGPASILEVWFPGQEDGNIIADLLFGKVNPSGKLPVTFPRAGKGFMDYITESQFPGSMVAGLPTVSYSEGLNIGYRWYDANYVPAAGCTVTNGQNDCVAFPFGYGLSYTTFALSNQSVAQNGSKYDVTVKVTNTGGKKGAEVVQVYVQMPSSANAGRLAQPPKRLVGFAKVELDPGAQQVVTVTIDPAASNHPLGAWDKASNAWVTPAGSYTVLVGNSSATKDLTSAGTINR
ncbi:glycoside hydrolase family 3 N-terminal domain-containing protein [Uliginosibacterium sp. H3]|uniref:Glycoside hydrolase family 3 N-terminal domain-containing protein n=1 Tax=Uliginosibacterium silvisoli TaxID=3114758 RepID=A0ABU6K8V9_9RHOO|nr:glycoside hydrolase family 3 N-terminal domain-containing protein [Uliginosibacterium sp. H3]